MDKFVIQGGARLVGEVAVSGAKNAALPILAATLLSAEPHSLLGLPNVGDVATMRRLLTEIGAVTDGDIVQVKRIDCCEVPYECVKTMRAAILVLGPLLARCGEAHVSLPGGCAIGARPVGLHLAALRRMGAEVTLEHGTIHAKARRLTGAVVDFERVTVTGTQNVMMAAVLAQGTTVIRNAACEPEGIDLAHFLIRCGARISVTGSEIEIEGVPSLGGASHAIIPDRIEAATLAIAGAITGGDVRVRDVLPNQMQAVIDLLRATGLQIDVEPDAIRVRPGTTRRPVDFSTAPYPGVPTDVQPQMMALLSRTSGVSTIRETIFEGRFNQAPELVRMGANIVINGDHATITGATRLSGAKVMASDLRAGAALVTAGLAAEGETEVARVYHIDRGYEALDKKLASIGAQIRRVMA